MMASPRIGQRIEWVGPTRDGKGSITHTGTVTGFTTWQEPAGFVPGKVIQMTTDDGRNMAFGADTDWRPI